MARNNTKAPPLPETRRSNQGTASGSAIGLANSGDGATPPAPTPDEPSPDRRRADQPSREQRIRERAYQRFTSRGNDGGGDPTQDWLDAESEIDATDGAGGI